MSSVDIPGVQPTMTIDEQVECEQAVLKSPEFREARSVLLPLSLAGRRAGRGHRPSSILS